MPALPRVVIGLLGPTLDAGVGRRRWERWRPSVALCQHADFHVDRFELLHGRHSQELADVVRGDIARVSPHTEVNLRLMDFADPWNLEEVYAGLHDFARSYPFAPEHESYFVHITTGTHIAQICMFLLTESRHFPGHLLQTSPSAKHHESAPGTYAIIDLNLENYDRLATRFQRERDAGLSLLKSGIATQNRNFNALVTELEHVALHTRDAILLTGPTGSGKSQLARRVFELKHQRRQVQGPFVEANCATLRGDSALSTLFGHIKGAFTGASHDRAGLLKSADRGILFLDEIGELGLDEQAMLLRALEDKTFVAVGSDRPQSSDFQLIAGTNRNLNDAVKTGRFREDLLARIDLWTFPLPALRERSEDIAPNLDYELEKLGLSRHTHVTITDGARQRYLAFAQSPQALWSGNFRDLNGSVRRMATLCQRGRIRESDVDAEISRLRARWQTPLQPEIPATPLPDTLAALLPSELDRFDEVQLREVVRVCQNADSLSQAGRELFAHSRAAKRSSNDADRIRKYLARFGLSWAAVHRDKAHDEV